MLSKIRPKLHQVLKSSSIDSRKKLPIIFQPLDSKNKDSRINFTCGDDALDQYLKKNALQDQKRYLARVFLGLNENTKDELISFYTLSAATIDKKDLPRGNTKPYQDTPAIRIGRLATALSYQHKGFGEETLFEILRKYLKICKLVGSIALVVDSYKTSEDFYKKYGFKELLTHKDGYKALYLLTKTILF